jgi:nucleoside-triphosphatase THEP1
VGKTTVCQAVAELARRRGYRPGGVITPAIYACPEQSRRDSHGTKVGFEAVDVGSGERWPLARTDPSTSSGHRRDLGGPQVGPYSFDPAALAKALRVLRRAATAGCDLFVVDEIGPLELEQGQGFAPILDLIHWRSSRTARLSSPKSCSAPAERETRFATPEEDSEDSLPGESPMHTLIVVRPALLDQLLLHLRGTECTVFSVTEENRNKLPMRIVKELWEDG